MATLLSTEHDDVDDVIDRGVIDIVHDQTIVINELRPAIDAQWNGWLGTSLVLPVRMVTTRIRYRDASGAPVSLVRDGIHHRNETVSGIVDPLVMTHARRQLGGVVVVGQLGGSLPVGRTEADPFAAMDVPHQHIQLGSGTFNLAAGIDVSGRRGPWTVGGRLFTQQVFYQNSRGYQAGDRYAAGVAVSRSFGWGSLRGGVDVEGETAERWGGAAHDDGNRGRVDVALDVEATWRATRNVELVGEVKVPVVTRVVGGQLTMPAVVEIGARWRIGRMWAVKPKQHEHHEHEHEHEHGHDEHGRDEHGHDEHEHEHHDHEPELPAPTPPPTPPPAPTPAPAPAPAPRALAKPDIAIAGKPGEAAALLPVGGKVTIFDFGASWCAPCKTLEPVLDELARAHPSSVALRKLDVVDWDSAAAAKYLTPGGFDLPHVKIFSSTGKLIFEKSPTPGGLATFIAEIRSLIDHAGK